MNYGPEGRPSCYFKQLICFKACCRAELFREDQALRQKDKTLGLLSSGFDVEPAENNERVVSGKNMKTIIPSRKKCRLGIAVCRIAVCASLTKKS